MRLVKDIASCIQIIKEHIKEVEAIPTEYRSIYEIYAMLDLIEKWSDINLAVYNLQRHLKSGNLSKALADIRAIKERALKDLADKLESLKQIA